MTHISNELMVDFFYMTHTHLAKIEFTIKTTWLTGCFCKLKNIFKQHIFFSDHYEISHDCTLKYPNLVVEELKIFVNGMLGNYESPTIHAI